MSQGGNEDHGGNCGVEGREVEEKDVGGGCGRVVVEDPELERKVEGSEEDEECVSWE